MRLTFIPFTGELYSLFYVTSNILFMCLQINQKKSEERLPDLHLYVKYIRYSLPNHFDSDLSETLYVLNTNLRFLCLVFSRCLTGYN